MISVMGRTTHGLTRHPLYNTWRNMIARCSRPLHPDYPRYGGRGISVCERWLDIRRFIEDIENGIGPRPGRASLDRIDNDGNYELGNVRWATARQQALNRGVRTWTARHIGPGRRKSLWIRYLYRE